MRSIRDIYDELCAEFSARSGTQLVSGGDMSIRLWAVAAEMFTLEAQADFVARQCFPQTAVGEYLDLHAAVRALERGQAKKASGLLRFFLDDTRQSDTRFAAGVRCMSADEAEFVTIADGLIPAGQSWCDVQAQAVTPGARGNIAAGAVCLMIHAPVGVSGVTNTAPFSGGCDAESDDALRQRVVASYRSLPNGANAAYYHSKVMACDGVAAVTVQPRVRGRGTVDICFATQSGIPTSGEIRAVQDMLEKEREICVDILVSAPQQVKVNVSAAVTLSGSADAAAVLENARQAVRDCFGGTMLGRNVYRARLTSAIMAVPGVENCSLDSPATDMDISPVQLPVLDSLEIRMAT